MVDWQVFVLGLAAVSLVVTAVRAIAREDAEARKVLADAASSKRPAA